MICAAVLFGLQCMGPNSVGFWSGDGFMEPKDYNERPYLRPRRVRITFIFCAIMVIVFSVLLVWFGLRKVSSTVVALEGSTSVSRTDLTFGEQQHCGSNCFNKSHFFAHLYRPEHVTER